MSGCQRTKADPVCQRIELRRVEPRSHSGADREIGEMTGTEVLGGAYRLTVQG